MAMSRKKLKLALSLTILKEIAHLMEEDEKKRIAVQRRLKMKPYLIRRTEHDLEAHMLNDVPWENDDDADVENLTLMDVHMFEALLRKTYRRLEKMDTVMRKAITPRVKLCITLRYIATGDSYKSLEFSSSVSRSTIGIFVPKVLEAIYDCLTVDYFKTPKTPGEWQKIADDFQKLWQFPHTLGALDGKHIRIKAPSNTASQFYNFKGYISVVVFAAVDAHSHFTYINVGCKGGDTSDETVVSDSSLYQALDNGTLNIPKSAELIAGEGNKIPYYFIGDDVFMLDRHIMTPYNQFSELSVLQENFNYRLNHARMVVDCAFAQLANRFRIFYRPIEVKPDKVDLIVKACCALHNYLTPPRTEPTIEEQPENEIVEAFAPIGNQSYSTDKHASRIREELSSFLITNDVVDF